MFIERATQVYLCIHTVYKDTGCTIMLSSLRYVHKKSIQKYYPFILLWQQWQSAQLSCYQYNEYNRYKKDNQTKIFDQMTVETQTEAPPVAVFSGASFATFFAFWNITPKLQSGLVDLNTLRRSKDFKSPNKFFGFIKFPCFWTKTSSMTFTLTTPNGTKYAKMAK